LEKNGEFLTVRKNSGHFARKFFLKKYFFEKNDLFLTVREQSGQFAKMTSSKN